VICRLTLASFVKKQPLLVSVANAPAEIVTAVAEMTVAEMVIAVVVVVIAAVVVVVIAVVVVVIVDLPEAVIAEAVVVQGVVTPKYPTSLRFGQLNHQALRLR
jgi:hypothetical protein